MSVFIAEHRSESLPARIALTFIENANAACDEQVRAARREGLPTLQSSILVRILTRPDQLSTVGDLAEALHLTPPTISDSLKALVSKGYLKRRRSPEDGRVVLFNLSRKGKEAAQRMSSWADCLESIIGRLEPERQVALMGCLSRLLRSQAEGGYTVAESMCASCSQLAEVADMPDRWICRHFEEELANDDLRTACGEYVPVNGSG
jgi:DNA-binding MarR family transcriptional regulator